MKVFTTISTVLLLSYGSITAQEPEKKPLFSGKYFGQPYPGITPKLILPELFNSFKYVHGRLLFSPDAKEAHWTITTMDEGKPFDKRLLLTQSNSGVWSEPMESFLQISKREASPSYTADGNKIFYQSRACTDNNDLNKDIDIWYKEKTNNTWSEPINIGSPVNSNKDESQPWIASAGCRRF